MHIQKYVYETVFENFTFFRSGFEVWRLGPPESNSVTWLSPRRRGLGFHDAGNPMRETAGFHLPDCEQLSV